MRAIKGKRRSGQRRGRQTSDLKTYDKQGNTGGSDHKAWPCYPLPAIGYFLHLIKPQVEKMGKKYLKAT
jgi:hypothetical protein